MRICASLGSADDIHSDDVAAAEIIEIRTDVFDTVPENVLKKGQTGLISFKGPIIMEMVPKGWIADIGSSNRSDIKGEVISSYHDFEGTPDAETLIKIMDAMNGDIVKGAFAVNSSDDLVRLFDISQRVGKRHVIIGMGELGKITRIRQKLMGNEFTFAYVGNETAPGQMSVRDMIKLGDDPMITGIVGSRIGYTRSPMMHDVAFGHSSIAGKYLVFDMPSLDRIDEMIFNYKIRGVNITKPYKTDIIEHIDACDRISEAVGAVNTVVNDGGKLRGYNTDVHGIESALRANSVNVRGKRALVLGSGGAARSCVYFLSENGCDVTITGRSLDTVKRVASDFSSKARERTSVAVKTYDIIVNCIPLDKRDDASEYPINIEQIGCTQTVFDMVYGETHLTDMANKIGCTVVRGEDMLAYQGAMSFELFTSKSVPYKVMREAI